jgi:hypothetical protein
MLATDELMSVPSFVGALLLLAVAGVRLNKQSLSAWRAIGGPSPFSATQRIRFSDVLSSRSDFVWSTFSRFLNSHTRGPQEPLSRLEPNGKRRKRAGLTRTTRKVKPTQAIPGQIRPCDCNSREHLRPRTALPTNVPFRSGFKLCRLMTNQVKAPIKNDSIGRQNRVRTGHG